MPTSPSNKKYDTPEEVREARNRRQREYRQRKQDGTVKPSNRSNEPNLDEESKRLQKNERQRLYRLRQKQAKEQIKKQEECAKKCKETCKPVAKQEVVKPVAKQEVVKPVSKPVKTVEKTSKKAKKKEQTTAENKPVIIASDANIKNLTVLYKKMFKTDKIKIFDFLQDASKVSDAIENEIVERTGQITAPATKKKRYTAINAIIRDNPSLNLDESVIDFYKKKLSYYSKKLDKIAGENEMTEKEKRNYLDWQTILSFKHFFKNMKDKTLFALITEIGVRRVAEYAKLVVSNEDSKELEDKNIILMENDVPTKIIYNKHKMEHKYNKQVLTIPPNLSKVLKVYIDYFELQNGEYLFFKENDKNKPYEKFDKLLNTLFKKVVPDKNISTNILRHSKITDFLNRIPTINQRKHLAYEMGHSIETQAMYHYIK